MAARFNLLLRLLTRHVTSTTFTSEPSQRLIPSKISIFTSHDFCKKWIQTTAELTNQSNEDLKNQDVTSLEIVCDVSDAAEGGDNNSNLKHNVLSNLKTPARHDMALVFTCKVCETRSMKTLCRESYEKGVVVVRCGACDNLHLIVDRLGWFGEPGSIEELLAARGEKVKKGSVDSLNLTLEDLAGKDSLKN